MHTDTPQRTNPTLPPSSLPASPGLPGEVSASSQTEGVFSSPQPPLTEPLLDDLLDPAMSPILICQIHDLTLKQLTTIIQSDDYQSATAAIQTINAARTPVISSTLHLQSLSTLREAADMAHQAATAATDTAASYSSPVLTGEVAAKRSEGVFSSRTTYHFRAQTNAIESLRKSATTLHKATRPITPPRRPIKSGTPFVIPPLPVSGVHGGTRIRRQRHSHELRDSNLSIGSTRLDVQARRTDGKPRKPWYRRV